GRLNPVETLQEEAICAICLDYFVEPVSIGCGHNFCRTPPPEVLAPRPRRLQTFTCPQCRKTFFQRNFRPNLQLANMVQIIRQLHPHPQRLAPHNNPGPSALGAPGGAQGALGGGVGGRGSSNLCEKHQEPLKLFCEVDEEAICVVCRESRSHKHHSVVPLEEVVQDYKVPQGLWGVEGLRGVLEGREEERDVWEVF
ncbi:TRI41 ligase, partial [Hemiprocne comata]|nr:TRI41 ligase [Hemiprocne comata]